MQEQGPDRFRAHGPETPRPLPGPSPLFELSVERSRELDRRAVEEYGIPSIVLMENAAIGLHRHAVRLLGPEPDPIVLICCGPGNNGGDGFALARHLHNASIHVRVVCTQDRDRYRGDAATNLHIIEHMGIEILDARSLLADEDAFSQPKLIVDALFGTGLSRAVEGVAQDLIERINLTRQRRNTLVLAVDIPSGLDAQTGTALGKSVVWADSTVTLAGFKPGMSRVEALEYLGDVHVASIGVPIELLRELGTPIEPKHRE